MIFNENAQGFVKLWKFPETMEQYVIGIDVATGTKTGDFSCGEVFNVRTVEQCAEWHGRIDPDLLGAEVYKMGVFYNEAFIGIEVNDQGLTVNNRLAEMDYPKIYFRQDFDTAEKQWTNKIGWNTNLKTRPLMVNELARLIRDREIILNSKELVKECMGFIRNEKGRAGAPPGGHDDRVMATAIAMQMRKVNPYAPLPKKDEKSREQEVMERLLIRQGKSIGKQQGSLFNDGLE